MHLKYLKHSGQHKHFTTQALSELCKHLEQRKHLGQRKHLEQRNHMEKRKRMGHRKHMGQRMRLEYLKHSEQAQAPGALKQRARAHGASRAYGTVHAL